jgi:hypothetical protein
MRRWNKTYPENDTKNKVEDFFCTSKMTVMRMRGMGSHIDRETK